MDNWDEIRTAFQVARRGTVSGAAEELGVHHATVIRHIDALEGRLGVKLFQRHARGYTPTEAGHVFYDEAKAVLAALENAEARVASFSHTPRGAIRVTAPPGVGRRIVAPLVPGFSDAYPETEVRMRLSDRKVDILVDGLDVAFFIGDPGNSNMKLRKIADCDRVLCAAPDYLARCGTPLRPDDLLDGAHNCLLLRYPRSPEYFWTLQTPTGPLKLEVRGRYDADDGDVLTDWALSGRGVVNKPRFDVQHHLAAGRLVEILTDTPPMPTVPSAV